MRTGGAAGCGDGGRSRAGGEEAAPPEPGLLVGQIRRYKANKEVMEKAAEVYARLKSRVLGPKIEAIQKATRTGPEKAEEILAGEEAPAERAEDEASPGEELAGGRRADCPGGAICRHSLRRLAVSPRQLVSGPHAPVLLIGSIQTLRAR